MKCVFQEDRNQVSFNVEELGAHIHGSRENLEKFKRIQEAMANDPILRFTPSTLAISRQDKYAEMCKKTHRLFELFGYDVSMMSHALQLFDEPIIGSLHWGLFIILLQIFGTEQQQTKWMRDSIRGIVIGGFGQTELGHGSDVQSLETIATFDRQSDSFIINSPTLTSTKWWIGGLGLTANHMVVQAQLFIDGKKYGVHSFIVPIRDMKTHAPLKGIIVGDIGPKYGFQGYDNGYLRMNNVSIPRENMLMKFYQVTKEGQFIKPENEKIAYAGLLAMRTEIIKICYLQLSASLTIGVRYSLVRRQFLDQNKTERRILDYQTQQDKLIPLLADTFAMFSGYKKIMSMYNQCQEMIYQRNDFSLLNELHSMISGLKSVYTQTTFFGIEKVRQSCGGHGFSQYSGLATILKQFSPMSTVEGENTIMLLQNARFLVKEFSNMMRGKKYRITYLQDLQETLQYKLQAETVGDICQVETCRKILRHRAAFCVKSAAEKLAEGVSHGMKLKQSWDFNAGNQLTEAAIAHTHFFTIDAFIGEISQISNDKIRDVMIQLCCLYGVSKILEKPQFFFESECFKASHLKLLREAKELLMNNLRKEALGLVEAFHYHDNTLRSAIGRSDGKVYETLLEWAQKENVVNKPETSLSINKNLRVFMGKNPQPKF